MSEIFNSAKRPFFASCSNLFLPKISEEEFTELFRDFDEDGNGTVSRDEMALFIKQTRGEEPLPVKKVPEPEPVAEEPVADEPVAEEPVADEPVA